MKVIKRHLAYREVGEKITNCVVAIFHNEFWKMDTVIQQKIW